MKRTPILFFVVVAIISFAGGSLWGFSRGAEDFGNLTLIPNAALATSLYSELEEKDAVRNQWWAEVQVDIAVDGYMEYSEDGNELYSRIFFPELLESKESYMDKLIEFRKQKPPSLQSLKSLPGMLKSELISPQYFEEASDVLTRRAGFYVSRGVTPIGWVEEGE